MEDRITNNLDCEMTEADKLDAAISEAYINHPSALIVFVNEDGETFVLDYNV